MIVNWHQCVHIIIVSQPLQVPRRHTTNTYLRFFRFKGHVYFLLSSKKNPGAFVILLSLNDYINFGRVWLHLISKVWCGQTVSHLKYLTYFDVFPLWLYQLKRRKYIIGLLTTFLLNLMNYLFEWRGIEVNSNCLLLLVYLPSSKAQQIETRGYSMPWNETLWDQISIKIS